MYRIIHIVYMHAIERPHMTYHIKMTKVKICNNNHIRWLPIVFCELNMWKTHTHNKQVFTKINTDDEVTMDF